MLKKTDTITPALDVNQFTGEGKGRTKDIVLSISLTLFPWLMYASFPVVPLKLAIPVWAIWTMRVWLVVYGQEKKRLKFFRNRKDNQYATPEDIMNIKNKYSNGCVEYVDGTCAYFIIAKNKEIANPIAQASMVRSILNSLTREYKADILIQNIKPKTSIIDTYRKVSFEDREVSKAILDIFDYNMKMSSGKYVTTSTIFIVKGKMSKWKSMEEDIKAVLERKETRAFGSIRIADMEEVEQIICDDVDTYIDFDEFQRQKYVNGNRYKGIEVVSYDVDDDVEVSTEEPYNERGFMVVEEDS